MKEEIVKDLLAKLNSFGLSPISGADSDITVSIELFDANVGSCEKKISYENAILIDEDAKIIFLYEKTTDKSRGFSFGSSSESSFQSGKSLKRRVKGSFIGATGAKIEYDFDIGEISKAIEAIAEKYGFKVKSVIRRKSAQFH